MAKFKYFTKDKQIVELISSESEEAGVANTGTALFDFVWDTLGLPIPGYVDLSVNHGLLNRTVYSQAANKIQLAFNMKLPSVVTDEDWLAEFEANGVCPKYSIGDGETTFRVPYIKGMEIASVDDVNNLPIGTYQPDQMRPITGEWRGNLLSSVGAARIGALESVKTSNKYAYTSGTYASSYLYLNSSWLGVNYAGEDTHSKRIFAKPMLKIRKDVSEDLESPEVTTLIESVQQLIDRVSRSTSNFLPGMIIHTSLNTVLPGFIDITQLVGFLPRSAFPDLITMLEHEKNFSLWVDESIWQAEVEEYGYTYKYSKGDGSTTFRPPYVTNCFIGVSGDKHSTGSASHDQIQNIVGRFTLSPGIANTVTGAFYSNGTATTGPTSGSNTRTNDVGFDASRVARTGEQTLPPAVWGKVLLCVASTSVDASEQVIAELIDTTLNKVSVEDYKSDWAIMPEVEHKTKRTFNGKPIYIKWMDLGIGPNATTKYVNHNIENIGNTADYFINIRMFRDIQDGRIYPRQTVSTGGFLSYFINATQIGISATHNESGQRVFGYIEYQKTTD